MPAAAAPGAHYWQLWLEAHSAAASSLLNHSLPAAVPGSGLQTQTGAAGLRPALQYGRHGAAGSAGECSTPCCLEKGRGCPRPLLPDKAPPERARTLQEHLLTAARQVEDQLDSELHAMENMGEDDLETLRQQRLQQMKAMVRPSGCNVCAWGPWRWTAGPCRQISGRSDALRLRARLSDRGSSPQALASAML